MIVYNITFHHSPTITTEVLEWLRSEFIPRALSFGFTDPLLTHILLPPSDEATEAYALGLKCRDFEFISLWESSDGATLLNDMFQRWGEYALAFSSPMQIIEI